MKEIILIKNGEIALKGLNRSSFEEALVKNIKWRLKRLGSFEVTKAQSTIRVRPLNEDADLGEACERIARVFGISGFSRALVTAKDMETIKRDAADYLRDPLAGAATFKVNAKRADKTFPFQSPDIQQEVGGALLEAFPHLKVDVHNPEVSVTVEIREQAAYVHAAQLPGAGGMPVSTSGEGLVLISGGIDSPVAAWMMARRGLKLSAIHFQSPPYTSERALFKVETLLRKVAAWSGDIPLYIVPFTKLQEALRDHCPEELFTILMRRLMMRIAIRVADRAAIPVLITGESLAQVASQTTLALAATNAAADRPVFRPLIGLDKQDIIRVARHIDTFETSILPYEDCCTVFTPAHPKTKPRLEYVEKAEAAFDFGPLLEEAVAGVEEKMIRNEE